MLRERRWSTVGWPIGPAVEVTRRRSLLRKKSRWRLDQHADRKVRRRRAGLEEEGNAGVDPPAFWEGCGLGGRSPRSPKSSRSAVRNDRGHDSGMMPVTDSDFRPVTFCRRSESLPESSDAISTGRTATVSDREKPAGRSRKSGTSAMVVTRISETGIGRTSLLKLSQVEDFWAVYLKSVIELRL